MQIMHAIGAHGLGPFDADSGLIAFRRHIDDVENQVVLSDHL